MAVLAAPLVIPFAEAVGLSVATLGMAKVADMVNEYIQENPEQSMKILSTIVPGVGIGEIFMKKGKDEEVEEEVEVEDVDARDLTRAEKAKEMKRVASVPTLVLQIWAKEYNGSNNWFALTKEPQRKRMRTKLNSSEFRYFRTAEGKI